MATPQISQRILDMAASQTLAMSQKSSELRAAGIDVINLSVGEPDFNTPEHIKQAAIAAIENNISHYPPVPGFPALRTAIANHLNHLDGLNLTPENIVVSAGAKHSLSNTLLATINPGDEVIVPVPAWVSYIEMIKLAGGIPVTVAAGLEDNFKITPQQLRDAITERTRMVMFCSPSNPSGSVYTRDELQALVEVLLPHPRITILSDEIYRHINYTTEPYPTMARFPEIAGRTIVVNGVSKAYAMTGWRIGFIAAPVSVAKAVNKLQGQTTSGISTIAQMAALAAYEGPQECVEQMRLEFERRRDLVVALAREIPGLEVNVPQGAFYLLPKVTSFIGKTDGTTTIHSDSDLCIYLLEKAHVATVAGSAFCIDGYIRLSYAASQEQLRRAMARIKETLALLK